MCRAAGYRTVKEIFCNIFARIWIKLTPFKVNPILAGLFGSCYRPGEGGGGGGMRVKAR